MSKRKSQMLLDSFFKASKKPAPTSSSDSHIDGCDGDGSDGNGDQAQTCGAISGTGAGTGDGESGGSVCVVKGGSDLSDSDRGREGKTLAGCGGTGASKNDFCKGDELGEGLSGGEIFAITGANGEKDCSSSSCRVQTECGDGDSAGVPNFQNTPGFDRKGMLGPVAPVDGTIDRDIGKYIGGVTRPDDYTVSLLLKEHWCPPVDYVFPYSVHMKGGVQERRFVRREHLQKYPWLVLSPLKKGLLCKFCVFFATGLVGGRYRTVQLKSLVTEPLLKFAKLLGKEGALEIHARADYHVAAVERAEVFLQNIADPSKVVINQVDTQRMIQVKLNRERLECMIRNVVFLARQNIPFRGHRDDGPLKFLDEDDSGKRNEGNFRELLRFRVQCGDSVLRKHIEEAQAKKMFASKTTQNALIECCGEQLLSTIIKRVQEAGMYSIIFDETTDIAHQSQLSLVLRYEMNGVVREDFAGFLDPHKLQFQSKKAPTVIDGADEPQDDDQGDDSDENDGPSVHSATQENIEEPKLTGEILGDIVVKSIKNLNLEPEECVGVGTDGCSVMTSEVRGAVQAIQKTAINALRCPCYNHMLNLSLSKSSRIQAIRNATGTLSEVVSFFTASSKRNKVLKDVLGGQLPALCETRWVQRHDGVLTFDKELPKVATALELVSQWDGHGDKSSLKAKSLLLSITDGDFILSITCLRDILAVTLPVSQILQTENFDLQAASSAIQDTIAVLEEKRCSADSYFETLFAKATKKTKEVGGREICVPRVTGRQVHRANVATESPASYYRVNLFIPLVESVLEDIKSRFPPEVLGVYRLNALLPDRVLQVGDATDDIQYLAGKYHRLRKMEEEDFIIRLTAEYSLWKAKWKREKASGTKIPTTACEALASCSQIFYPCIRFLLRLLVTLPVSVASAERSFSTLRLLKTWIRARCGDERLSGLALMYIHRDIPINRQDVIERYALRAGKRRKHDFVV